MKKFVAWLLGFLRGEATGLSHRELRGRHMLAAALGILGLVMLGSAARSLPRDLQSWVTLFQNLGGEPHAYLQVGKWSFGTPVSPFPPAEPQLMGIVRLPLLEIALLAFCFRGSRAALALTRLCAGLHAAFYAVVIVLIALNIPPMPVPAKPAYADDAWSTAKVFGIAFVCWALFVSRSVQAFLQRQRSLAAPPLLDRMETPPPLLG